MREGARVVVTIHGTFIGTGYNGMMAVRSGEGLVTVKPEEIEQGIAEIREACPGCEDGDWQADSCDECMKHGLDADADRVVDDAGRDSIIRTR